MENKKQEDMTGAERLMSALELQRKLFHFKTCRINLIIMENGAFFIEGAEILETKEFLDDLYQLERGMKGTEKKEDKDYIA